MIRRNASLLFLVFFCSSYTFSQSPSPLPETAEEPKAQIGLLQILETPPANRAALLDAYETEIRAIGIEKFNFGNVGAVAEALAMASMRRTWNPKTYEVLSGIVYTDATDGRTIGELDIAILHRESGDFMMVSEVKTSTKLASAAKKAESQLKRFRDTIASEKKILIKSTSKPPRIFTREQFTNITQFRKIGSRGALEAGFDLELNITRAEVDLLQRRIRSK